MNTQPKTKARFCLTEEERELLDCYNSLSAPLRAQAIDRLVHLGSLADSEEKTPEEKE